MAQPLLFMLAVLVFFLLFLAAALPLGQSLLSIRLTGLRGKPLTI
jgi:hypothetical protein